ncbi:MAG TPA: glycosyltransferase 87 family protein [Ktedonobacterales bacterium]|nr:glycosyltransferase 87 family protein [Ktedonobacterales bacterium]
MPRELAMEAVDDLAKAAHADALDAAQRRDAAPSAAWRDALRPLALAALALVALPGYVALAGLAHPDGTTPPPNGPVALMLALVVPYGAACWLVLARPRPLARLWRRVEWGTLVVAAVAFRAVLAPARPQLSKDAYRYLWDARLIAHGYSPYLHGPNWPGFAHLRDAALYPLVPWKDVPTIYPPAAQLLYRVADAFAPGNVVGIKVEMLLCDLLVCGLLALLLRQRGQDPRRAIIYLWAPLPIVEFALNGHEDAAAIACMVAALLVNGARWRGARAVVGVLLGVATLIKLYPVVLVVALWRRRDWPLLAGLALTITAGYAPFWRDGLAATGFLSIYLTEVNINYGGALLLLRWLGQALGAQTRAVQLAGAAGAALGLGVLAWLRLDPARRPSPRWLTRARPALGPAGAAAGIVALWLAFSPHVFPWYAAALLPFCALFLARRDHPLSSALALGAWTFCGVMPLAYGAFAAPALAWLYPTLYLVALVATLGAYAWQGRARLASVLDAARTVAASTKKGIAR